MCVGGGYILFGSCKFDTQRQSPPPVLESSDLEMGSARYIGMWMGGELSGGATRKVSTRANTVCLCVTCAFVRVCVSMRVCVFVCVRVNVYKVVCT